VGSKKEEISMKKETVKSTVLKGTSWTLVLTPDLGVWSAVYNGKAYTTPEMGLYYDLRMEQHDVLVYVREHHDSGMHDVEKLIVRTGKERYQLLEGGRLVRSYK